MSHRAAAPVPDRRALVIANQSAGGPEEALEEALDVLRAHHFSCTRISQPDPKRLHDVLRHGRANHDVVVVAGGDGTLNLALPAFLGEGAPLGILPLGTANDLARTLGLPANPVEAALAIATGRVTYIDVGRVNGRYFFNVAHIGFGASARRFLTPERKHRWHVLAYPISLFHSLRTYRPFMVRIHVDGQRRKLLVLHVAVGNGRYFGGGVPIAEDAGIRDARLDVSCIRAGGLLTLLRALKAMLRGKPAPDSVWRASGRQVELYTSRPRRINADGEEISRTPGFFEVIPRTLPVVVQVERADGGCDVSG